MKKLTLASLACLTLLVSGPLQSRDTELKLSIKEAMEAAQSSGKLDDSVKLFFGKQAHPKPQQTLGTFTTNKKTNFFNKTDKEGCDYVFLSAIIALQERAKSEGGNAVIDIVSYYKKSEFPSEMEYECHAGNFTGGVALRGTVVKL